MLNKYFTPAFWLVVTIALFLLSNVGFEPNDIEQILQRSGTGSITPVTQPVTVPLGDDGEFLLTATGCTTNGDGPFENPRFFMNRECSIVADTGDTLWYQIILENQSPYPIEGIMLSDTQSGDIALDDDGWKVEPISVGARNPDSGWATDAAGTLPNTGDVAVYYFSTTLAGDQSDPFENRISVDFNVQTEEDLNAIAPDGTTISKTVNARIKETYSIVPNIWLPSAAADSERVIDITSSEIAVRIYALTLLIALVELLMLYIPFFEQDKLIGPIIRGVGIFLVFWSIFGHEVLWDQILGWLLPGTTQENNVEILYETNSVIGFAGEHLELVIVSALIIIPFGLFVSILVTREGFEDFLPLVSGLVNLGQTIPTLAIVAIMAPIIGLGFTPAIIALVAYGLLPVVRNTIAGLDGVDPFIIQSAQGMGMTPLQILLQIELPIASRVIMAGIRTSMVVNVGTAALGAYVISGGLGVLISNGLGRTIFPWVLLGAIPAALLAILLDYILGRVEYVLTPKGLQIES